MCHGDPSICRCGWCFVARMDPSKFTGNPGLLGPGPFYYSLKKIEEEEKERYSALKKREEKEEKESTKKSIREILKRNGLIKDDED